MIGLEQPMEQYIKAVRKDRDRQFVIEYSLIDLTQVDNFCEETAGYFIKSWMSSRVSEMLRVQQNWDQATDDEKEDYFSFLSGALFYNDYKVLDFPEDGYTNPIGSFAETMLRWSRQTYGSNILHMMPPVPRPPREGGIDLVEVAGIFGHYDSFRLTMWEVKGSDKQISSHTSKVYKQLQNYPTRFYAMANELSERYREFGNDPEFKRFLSELIMLVRQRDSRIHYGVFVTFDPSVDETKNILPNLHEKPHNHPANGLDICHHLHMLLIPDFKMCRLKVWQALNLHVTDTPD